MSTTSHKKPLEGSARERLLAAANELFYAEGVNNVGIDRVIERAGVAKASLYSTYGSKDELVRAYLEARAALRKQRITERIALHRAPRAKLASIFDLLAEMFATPGFRGCAFVNVSSESPGERVRSVCSLTRAFTRSVFTDLARADGCAAPDHLASQLMIIYDGAMVSATMERERDAASIAREMALALFDAATRTGPAPL